MADFKTHLLGAAVASGVAATMLAMTQTISDKAAISYFVFGIAGGLAPDVDSQSSVPIRIAHRVLSSLIALLMVLSWSDRLSLLELVILGAATYALVRYVGFALFSHFTVHRGIVHSLPSAAVFGLITVIVSTRFFDSGALHAWLCGVFMVFGFCIHLLLDEMYSVDLLGRRFKRSFGTAMKLGDFDNWPGTAALYAAVAGLFFLAPPPGEFLELMFSAQTYEQVMGRLLPGERWFPGLLQRSG